MLPEFPMKNIATPLTRGTVDEERKGGVRFFLTHLPRYVDQSQAFACMHACKLALRLTRSPS